MASAGQLQTETSGVAALQPARRADLGAPRALGQLPAALVARGPALAQRLAARFTTGTLVVEDPEGGFVAGRGPEVSVRILDQRAYAAILRYGSEGLGESYLAGWWEAEDLASVVALLLRELRPLLAILDRLGRLAEGPWSALERLGAPGRHRDRRNVQAHYDLPDELFELMLDETMSYSCAFFEFPGQDLAAAQLAKLDRLCRKLELTEDDHLVEIGTGWGGLAIYAAQHYGCRVTTTTVSDAQRRVAERRVADAGVADRVTVLGVDFRDLDGRFDKLVSVEMLEAVDWRNYDAFFRACRRLVRPEGRVVLQVITIADQSFDRAKRHDDFIRRHIFPGGCLPSLSAISAALARSTDLVIRDVEDLGPHYGETLRRWRARFEASWPTLSSFGFDEPFHRLWRLYLAYCEAAFDERHISDLQLVLTGPEAAASMQPRPH